jgi:hypothetical protein
MPAALVIAPVREFGDSSTETSAGAARQISERCEIFPTHAEFPEAIIIASGRVNQSAHWRRSARLRA